MKSIIKYALVVLTIGILISCNGSKAYYKRGIQLEEAGMYKEAASYYLTSLRKNPDNIDARIAIKKNGQKVLDQLLADFYQSYTAEDHKKAIYEYLEAKDFHENVNAFAEINFPEYYKDYYEESKDVYLKKRYKEALILKDEEKYDASNEIFAEIMEIEPEYKDVSQMEKVSRIEPIYRKGKAAMANEQYRAAYRYFDEVLSAGPYKDAASLKQESLEEAAFTVAFLPVQVDNIEDQQVADKFYSLVMQEVLNLDNPFIKVIDRSNIEKILQEQKLALSGMVDGKTSAEAGKILGAKAVFSADIINYKNERKNPKSYQKKGYQAIKVRKYNKATDSYYTVTNYKKVYYKEVIGANQVSASIRFNMSSSETAEILVSDLITDERSDVVNYVIYEGDPNNLFPGTWRSQKYRHSEDKVFTDFKSKNALQSKLRTKKRSLKSTEVLRTEMLQQMAKRVAQKLEAYDNSL